MNIGARLYCFAGSVIAAAYAVVCVRIGTPWPWMAVVHESGSRTLIGTVLYFEHAARELPMDILLGAALGASLAAVRPSRRRHARGYGWVTLAVVAVIVGGAWLSVGSGGLVDNLGQYHTRPGDQLEWGSHWRYHLLSRLALMLLSAGGAGLLLAAPPAADRATRPTVALGGALGVFALATLVFSPDPARLLLALRDPLYLGHQARELATHLAVTIPLAWGVILAREPRAPASQGPAGSVVSRRRPWSIVSLVVGGVVGAYLLVASLVTGAPGRGQTSDPWMLLAPHVFEHTFSYVLVAGVAGLTYAWAARFSR